METHPMKDYLVTDLTTGKSTWITAPSKREACVMHENERRMIEGSRIGFRYGMPQLPIGAPASYDNGRVAVGDSAIIGLDCWTGR